MINEKINSIEEFMSSLTQEQKRFFFKHQMVNSRGYGYDFSMSDCGNFFTAKKKRDTYEVVEILDLKTGMIITQTIDEPVLPSKTT